MSYSSQQKKPSYLFLLFPKKKDSYWQTKTQISPSPLHSRGIFLFWLITRFKYTDTENPKVKKAQKSYII